MNFDVNKFVKQPQQVLIKFFNASLEDYRRQFDGQVFKFTKNNATEVPLNLVEHVYDALRDHGVFPIFPTMTKEEIKEAHRQALLDYVNGQVRMCIKAYQWKLDEGKKNGVQLDQEPRHKRMLRWRDEIYKMLNQERPLEEELSFDNVDKEAMLNPFAGIEHAVVETPFDRAEAIEKRKARGKKTSFENVDLGDIV